MIKLLWCIIAVCTISSCFGQPDQKHIDMVKEAYSHFNNSEGKSQNTIYYNYSIVTSFIEGDEVKKDSSGGNMVIRGEKMIFKSGDNVIFCDANKTININKVTKIVSVAPTANTEGNTMFDKQQKSQEMLFKEATNSSLKDVKFKNRDAIKIVFKISENGQKLYGTENLVYILDSKSGELMYSGVFYVKGKIKKSAKLYINELNFNAENKASMLNGDFTAKIIGANGKLAGEYIGYKLIDYRKKQ